MEKAREREGMHPPSTAVPAMQDVSEDRTFGCLLGLVGGVCVWFFVVATGDVYLWAVATVYPSVWCQHVLAPPPPSVPYSPVRSPWGRAGLGGREGGGCPYPQCPALDRRTQSPKTDAQEALRTAHPTPLPLTHTHLGWFFRQLSVNTGANVAVKAQRRSAH